MLIKNDIAIKFVQNLCYYLNSLLYSFVTNSRYGSVGILFFVFFNHCYTVNAQGNGSLSGLQELQIFQDNQNPKAIFFREPEQNGRKETTDWNEWYPAYCSLMGFVGKAVKEEVTVDNFEQVRNYFNELKALHPEQAVIVHICGRGRDPHFARQPFFAGHWVYYNGAIIEESVPAEEGETVIKVSNPNLFKKNVGLTDHKINEDIGLCKLAPDGKPDWSYSEQVKLIDIDYQNKTITVERGAYETNPLEFNGGEAYAAAHVSEGPEGSDSYNWRWYYNHSTLSPKDKNGKQAGDIYAEQLAGWFKKDSLFENFDGVEFDVLHHVPMISGLSAARGMDFDADGIADGGLIDGYPTYGVGAIKFLKKLRELMGNEKLIMADYDRWFHQRSVGILNGTEHENFPTGDDDDDFNDWGGGINRLLFAAENSQSPQFNYIKSKKDDDRIADIRLAFAAAVICDATIAETIPSGRTELSENVFVWDELKKGTENELGWLGHPVDTVIRLATQSTNVLDGVDINEKIVSSNCQINDEGGELILTKNYDAQEFLQFQLGNLNCPGQDLFIRATVKADPMANYPSETARIMQVAVAGGVYGSNDGNFMNNVNLVLDDSFERVIDNTSMMHENAFNAGFYFRQFNNPATLTFNFEGNEPVTISDIEIYAAPDVLVRKFEGGLVIANPSKHEVEIDLDEIWPGERFTRLKGSGDQDPFVNDGQEVSGKVKIDKLDGLFLVRETNTTGIVEPKKEESGFWVYPNPAKDFISIELQSLFKQLYLFDYSGRTVMEITPLEQEHIRISTEAMTPGIYLIKALRRDGTSTSQQLVIGK
ncbi:T9SS type A sorting domain-containing protein [Gaoshiqia sediminis]|uniref:T9SS type A sorting domain-containing protein n=1 Tax=Gaoshiqia sediminis TaxID=2986998 RepID=A0AA42C7U8_9BACT|nr:T9SS type A sorting domain-containing protein [Gaoshiqia sediminis]MCW0483934.1 T9SS type A sorting domain-containing protein [Gaoshiqia sediminis]